jgi:DnaK suppressor protein
MNKRNLIYFRKKLIQELKDLMRGVDCNFDGLNESEENMPDLIDRASSFIDRSLSQNICDRESLKVRKIELALEDIGNGVYGICARCGEDIAIKRLKANPVARHCISCKTEIETRERLTGS